MLILGIDLETGGSFDAPLEDNFITELGAVLWDTETNTPVQMINSLIDCKRDICQEAEDYTGISTEMARTYGKKMHLVLEDLKPMFDQCNYVLAHNGLRFDKPILDEVFPCNHRTWIDSLIDVPYPKNCTSKNLTYLAGFHKILNCFQHRAITDVLTMFEVVSKYDWQTIIAVADTPIVRARAIMAAPNWKSATSMAAFNVEKDLVKKAGFKWDATNKTWEIETRELLIGQRSQEWDFKWKIIQGEKP